MFSGQMDIYNRDEQLKERLNRFLVKKMGLPEYDYYGNMTTNDFLELKSVLSDINNSFTLKVSIAFAEWLAKLLEFDPVARSEMQQGILATKPNANGYDIEITHPKKVIAEVKCNIPINNGAVYGSAQKHSIVKDIEALLKGKSKSKVNPSEFLKFMVFLDRDEIRQATKNLVKNLTSLRDNIRFVEGAEDLTSKDFVYIVFVAF